MSRANTQGGVTGGPVNPELDAKSGEDLAQETATAYAIFEKCITRASNLIAVEESTGEVDEISEEHYCDCFRAAIVLSISALDAFVRKVVVSEVRKLIAEGSQPLSKELSDYLKNLLNQDRLLDAARKYNLLDVVESAMKEDFSTKSFQGEWRISSYMRMIGYDDVFSRVAVKADINEKNLKRKLSLFTNRRHIIAHSGDYDLNKVPHAENSISKGYAEECISTVSMFAATVHQVMDKE